MTVTASSVTSIGSLRQDDRTLAERYVALLRERSNTGSCWLIFDSQRADGKLLIEWNEKKPYPRDRGIDTLFEAIAANSRIRSQ